MSQKVLGENQQPAPSETQAGLSSKSSIASNGSYVLAEDFINSSEFEAFIGKNSARYRYYFERYFKTHRGKPCITFITWNWPAFFLGAIWFAYRKMYVHGCTVFWIVVLLPYWITKWALVEKGGAADWTISIACGVLPAMVANGLYICHVSDKLKKVTSQSHLHVVGGTSIGAALAFAALELLWIAANVAKGVS